MIIICLDEGEDVNYELAKENKSFKYKFFKRISG
jgi:hypothetical protein